MSLCRTPTALLAVMMWKGMLGAFPKANDRVHRAVIENAGQNCVVVPEEFQALKQCAEMLGARITPAQVEQLLQQCAKHAKRGGAWPVRRQALEALGALAASLQACSSPADFLTQF